MAERRRLRTLRPKINRVLDGRTVRALSNAPSNGNWAPDSVRGTAAQRGYGTAWRKLRAEILARDNGLCMDCLAQGRITAATQVDHRVPKAHGGTDDPSNLASICTACHLTKTAKESRP